MLRTAERSTYRLGNAWFICDRCGQRWRRSSMITEWDQLKVCPPCLDPRPPQMMPPNVYPEGIPFPDARPPQDNPDRLMDDAYLQAITGGGEVTNGVYPIYANGQKSPIGAFSPRQVIVDSIPKRGPSANQLADDITLRTGPVFASSVLPTDPSPGPVPITIPPEPPFYISNVPGLTGELVLNSAALSGFNFFFWGP